MTTAVQLTGAANTWIHLEGGTIRAANTDIDGVIFALERAGIRIAERVLILGAGGAACAAAVAISRISPHTKVSISGRRAEQASNVARRYGGTVVAWGDGLANAVVINATSLGMRGEALPQAVLAGATGLLDMPYGGQPSPAEIFAAAHNLPFAPGLDMLVGQARAAFMAWTGTQVDVEELVEAARRLS